MVMSSAQIAQMNSSFQQQSMMQMQHAGMISQHAGQGAGTMAQGMVGGGINTAAAIGAPLAMGGMMLAGADPVSLGARAIMPSALGGAATTAGRFAAGGAGLGIGAGLMAAQYVGGQMMTGMQQQQQLRGQLGQGFQHMNAYGGRGFTREETSQIGSQFRGMTEQRGPGGEFTNMEELGRLASNMGRMGMAQGVKDAKDFNEKFKKMMSSVRDIAKEFSTSLEEAQQIMGSMRGSGVFGHANQVAMAKGMKQGALGAGVSMDEMGQMANIGSQISRSIGGRGNAGGVAGVKSLSTVGGAFEAGVLSEEDIFNATGLTGAAGKQSMATSRLQRDAKFLKKGRGRQLLAAIATKDGGVDMEAVRKIQSGEMSVQDTIRMRKGHLNTMSRANFIRNEGKLRGEAMAAFGGDASSSAHLGWLRGKGYDPASMDDKAMIAFTRHTGMDDDEARAEIKMLRNRDAIQDKRSDSIRENEIVTKIGQRNKKVGIEGVKRKFETARQDVQNNLQQAGADIMNSAEDRLEAFINDVTGEYVRRVAQGTAEGVRLAKEGGGGSRMKALTGFGGKDISRGLIEGVYGAKISNEGTDQGVAAGDLKFGSEGERQRGLSNYLFGGKEESTASKAIGFTGSLLGGMMGGITGAHLGASAGSFLGIGQMSESERKAGAASLETKEGLERSRSILGARTQESKAKAAKESIANVKQLEEDGANKGSIAAAKQVSAVARIRGGESKEKVMAETGLTEDEIKRTTASMHASEMTDRLVRLSQAGEELMTDMAESTEGMMSEKASMMHEGPVYDEDGKELKGMAALDAIRQGNAYTTSEGGFATKAADISEEHSRLKGLDRSKMSEDEKKGVDAAMGEQVAKMNEALQERRGTLEDKSEEDLQKIIAEGGPSADMARRELSQDKVLARAQKSGAKGATLSALAQVSGGSLSKEDAADLFGKEGKELMSGFASATGMDMSKMSDEERKKMTVMLDKAAKGGDIDKELTGVEGAMRHGLLEGKKDQQDSSAAMNDPSFRKLESMDSSMNDLLALTKLANSTAAEQLEALKASKKDSPDS